MLQEVDLQVDLLLYEYLFCNIFLLSITKEQVKKAFRYCVAPRTILECSNKSDYNRCLGMLSI